MYNLPSDRGDTDGEGKGEVPDLPVVGPLVVHAAGGGPPLTIDVVLHRLQRYTAPGDTI